MREIVMRRERSCLQHLVVLGVVLAAVASSGFAQDEPEPVEVEVTLRGGQEFTADLIRAEPNAIILRRGDEEQSHPVKDIHPWALFEIRLLAMGFKNPRIFVEYGRQELNWYDDTHEAEKWFKRALDRDEGLQDLVQTARDNPQKPVDINPDAATEDQKFRQSDPEVDQAILELTDGWHELIKDKINKNCVKVETEHFLIFTTWKKADHKALGKVCEKLYSRLCKEFDISKKSNIWTPKLPIYVFWTEREFDRFNVICGLRPRGIRAGGYCWSRLGVTYVVLNQVKYSGASKKESQMWFFEVLVHETTHAFNTRYLTNIRPPRWFDEGTAELMAAELVPGCYADRWWRSATRYVRDGSVSIEHNFDRFRGGRLDYAVMQSIVRFMMFKKKKQFITFYKLCKQGMDQYEALEEAYGWSYTELVDHWLSASRKM